MKSRKIILSSFALVFLMASGAKAGSVPYKSICIGDNDQNVNTNSCFKGLAFNKSSSYAWKYVTGNGFYNGNARITKYASNGSDAATWWFKTPVKGDVWFSVWVPSTNATANPVYYVMSCGDGAVYTIINQNYYSATWVTLKKVGNYPAGTTCNVGASKYLTPAEINSGGRSYTNMAIDAMKMTIY